MSKDKEKSITMLTGINQPQNYNNKYKNKLIKKDSENAKKNLNL